tara:strand:+ start:39629 stop:41305 length:1677 start_codon:yes stop_codon:yes gene_type:complete
LVSLVAPTSADAFCGFYVAGADDALYNNATQIVLMRSGKTTVLSMQNNYKGPPSNFAMVVPVPEILSEDNVKILPADVFKRVDRLAAPRLVEYWEQDPCMVQRDYGALRKSVPRPSMSARGGARAEKAKELGVTVEAEFAVGEYEVVILSAKFSTGLEQWLTQENYKIPAGAEKYLRPYVESGSKFFVAKVNAEKVTFKDGQAQLSPLRFHYQSDEFSLPVRLGLMNSEGKQDLIVHILAQGTRYEVANYPNVTIPTNLNVEEKAGANFGEFYAALFDRTLEKNPKAVVTEYSWSAASCDPCPTPALNWSELATLGYDVAGGPSSVPTPPSPSTRPMPPSRARPMPSRGRRVTGRPSAFVLTRLHARYSKDDLGEDLVFKEAKPIAGGREHLVSDGKLEEGSSESYSNNFQGRYAMRHEWKGPIECTSPVRGRWGGPPNGGSTPPVKPALDLAFAARGSMSLTQMVPDGIPELGIQSKGKSVYNDEVAPEVESGPKVPTYRSKTKLPDSLKSDGSKTKSKSKSGDGGCNTGGQGAGALWLSVLVLAMLLRKRRWHIFE